MRPTKNRTQSPVFQPPAPCVQRAVCTAHYAVRSLLRAVCSAQCAVCSLQCAVLSAQCVCSLCRVQFVPCAVCIAVRTVQCALCSVQCVTQCAVCRTVFHKSSGHEARRTYKSNIEYAITSHARSDSRVNPRPENIGSPCLVIYALSNGISGDYR